MNGDDRHEIRRRAVTQAGQGLQGLHPVLARVYAARGLEDADSLASGLRALHPPELLKGMDAAVDLLEKRLRNGQSILVLGDFDADGATSCALCMRALKLLGAASVSYLVPNRFEYGYGLTPEIVEVAARVAPDLIMTVDNGIASVEGVRAAAARGIPVLVTDHHLPGEVLPAAAAIVNPNQRGDEFPSKALAGVGVAFYVMLALRARLREGGWFVERGIPEPNLAVLLDLVALGTVADVVPLDANNRILVRQGLARIRAGHCVPGIRALLEVGRRNPQRAVAADLGFTVGPRLNAAGRLEDMSLGIECLLCDDEDSARRLAAKLDELNLARREIESDMQAQAMQALNKLHLDTQQLPSGLSLYDAHWHQGVIGILAARIKERFHRPVIAFARMSDVELKGSARSVPGLHIRDVLDAVASRHPGLISKFGGHAMAAGLSLPLASLQAFSEAFDAEVRRHLDPADLRGVIYSDGELLPEQLTLELAGQLREGGPWGQGFAEPVFDGHFRVVDQRVVGEKHLKLTVRPVGGGEEIDAIAFNQGRRHPLDRQRPLRLAYRLDVNEFRGVCRPQLLVEYLEQLNTQ